MVFTDLVSVKKIDLFIEVMKSDINGRQNKLKPSLASKCMGPKKGNSISCNIYIFIAIALDESIFFDVLHFPMKNIKSRDLEATPMGGATSNHVQ